MLGYKNIVAIFVEIISLKVFYLVLLGKPLFSLFYPKISYFDYIFCKVPLKIKDNLFKCFI